MFEKTKTAEQASSRRKFLLETARSACGAALVGLGLGLYGNRQAVARPVYTMRPPGALPDKKFLAACIRCGQCVKICPAKPKALSWRSNERIDIPVYDYSLCIRCYCCQETCPSRAISVEIPLLGKLVRR